MQGLTDEQRFYKLQDMGIYPSTWTWATRGGQGGILTEKGQRDIQENIRVARENRAIEKENRQIERDNIVIGDQYMPIKEWNSLPEKYQSIALKSGFDKMRDVIDKDTAEFNRTHVVIGEKAMTVDDWNALPENYQSIAIKQGFDRMQDAIKRDSAAQDAAAQAIEPYKQGDGYNLIAARLGGVTAETMRQAGFKDKDIKEVDTVIATSKATGVATAEENTFFYQGKVISAQEREKIIKDYTTKRDKLIAEGKMFTPAWEKLGTNPENLMTVSPQVGRRKLISASEFVFPPAMALKPEYTVKDVPGIYWGIGAANVVLITAPYIAAPLKGMGAGINVTKGGAEILGSTTAYKAGVAALQAGAGAVYTTATVQGIKSGELKGGNLAFAIVVDTAILASAFASGVGAVRSLKAPKQGVFKFDFSGKAKTMTGSSKVASAIDDIQGAVIERDTLKLKEAAKRLELAAADAPKELQPMIEKQARIVQANADKYIDLAKNKPTSPDLFEQGIKANEKHLDLLEKQLKKTKNPATKEAIEKAIKETKKVITETKVKTKPIIQDAKVLEGKDVPATTKSKALTVKEAKERISTSKEKIKAGSKEIPVKDFSRYTPSEVAKKYKVAPAAIVWAVSRLPVPVKNDLVVVSPGITVYPVTRPIEKPATRTITATPYKTAPDIEERIMEAQKAREQSITGVYPSASPMESTRPEPAPKPSPRPEPAPQPSPKPAPTPKPEPKPEPETPAPTPTPKRVGLPRPPGSNASDDKKREFLAAVQGFVANRRGELNGKPIWYVDFYPYDGKKDRLILHGKLPKGAKPVSGKGSVKRSLYGKGVMPKREIWRDTGAVDDVVTPSGRGVVIRSVAGNPYTENKKQKEQSKTGMVVRTRDLGGGIEMDKKGRAHIKLV